MMKRSVLISLLFGAHCLAGCSVVGIQDYGQPHLATMLEAYGGFIGLFAASAGKNAPSQNCPQGKGVYIWNTDLVNIGKESKGLRITVKGGAVENGQTANFVALIKSEGTPELDKTLHLLKEGNNTWTGEALIPLTTQTPSGILSEGKCTQHLTVDLYADTRSPGESNLESEIAPYEESHDSSIKLATKLQITKEHQDFEKLFSQPDEFQLDVYPKAKFSNATRTSKWVTTSFTSKDKPEKIAAFYKDDLARRGYQLKDKLEFDGEMNFGATNNVQHIELDVVPGKHEDDETEIGFRIIPEVVWQQDAAKADLQDRGSATESR